MSEDQHALLTKSEVCRIKGWSDPFFDNLRLPRYPIGKRSYYKLADIEPTLEAIKWEYTKSKTRRTTSSRSLTRASGIEEARERIKKRMQKASMQQSGAGYC